jgi:hypothetical protein
MSLRRVWIGIAVGAVGLGSLLWARSKDGSAGLRRPSLVTTRLKDRRVGRTSLAGRELDGWPHRSIIRKGVAVDGEYAYVVTGGFAKAENAVLRISATTGAVETLVRVPQILSGELAVDDKYVYFSIGSGQRHPARQQNWRVQRSS